MIIAGMLVKNEANRWLTQILSTLKVICKKIIIVDDCSEDMTPMICESYGCEVHNSEKSLWETNEVSQRNRLFDLCNTEANENDWIMIIDADEILDGSIGDFLLQLSLVSNDVRMLGFKLYDMWDANHYRSDQYWNAHERYWPMLVRPMKDIPLEWQRTPLHCGRFPLNASKFMLAVDSLKIKHMGWSTIEDRQIKYERYMRADPEGKYGILEHYKSILDKNPNLVKYEK